MRFRRKKLPYTREKKAWYKSFTIDFNIFLMALCLAIEANREMLEAYFPNWVATSIIIFACTVNIASRIKTQGRDIVRSKSNEDLP